MVQATKGTNSFYWPTSSRPPAPAGGTAVQRRASKELPQRGGWNAFVSNLTSLNNVFVPAQIAIRGGPNSWFGWPDVPKLDALREEWLSATTSEDKHRIAADIQRQMFADLHSLLAA